MSFRSNKHAIEKDSGEEGGALSGLLVSVHDPTGAASEAYRALRTNLLYALADSPSKMIVVTSAGPAEGKSTTCANLGVVLSEAEKDTLVLECDLRKPRMGELFGAHHTRGLTDVLAGESDLADVWQEPLPKLRVVSAGPPSPRPAELLSSERFGRLLEGVREEFDYALIDAPPVGTVADPMILASLADGVLLVLDSRTTREEHLHKAMRALRAVGANVLGTVMNNVKPTKGGYHGYAF